MPEGDTVWLAAKRMHDALAGRPLLRSDFRVPKLATADITGRTVTEVLARGKHMLTRLDDGLTLHTHFLMDGTWHLVRPGARWHGGPAYQVRLVLANADWEAVGYRLHDIALVRTDEEDQLVGHLGPDVLGPDWDPAEAARRIAANPDRPIGEVIMDQRVLAGVGNLYKAETLFLTGTHPWTPSGKTDPAKLVATAYRLMRANRDHPEQTTTGSMRRGEQHWVFGRARRPCLRCGTPIEIAELRPADHPEQGRLTYWCPRCQPRV
ncbi:MAG TPA: DNA-formamidopyrimidine glycosylase family protein [Mycobacteriales bacterium]|nr:DNA-formamidopyrimidine glycosylase family protein [Mycobacteriales bacterium]